MELTIEQSLQQGIAAHKEGKLENAERLYRTILQSQPLHPDANHNLGLLAVSMNKANTALPLFKTALEANPKIEQFWLSYIDALTKEKQFANAKAVLEQGKNQGVEGEKIDALEERLTLITQTPRPTLPEKNKSLSLSEKCKKQAERKKKKKATKQNLKANNPSQQQISNLLQYYQTGRFSDAETLAVKVTQEFPKHQFAWKILGAVLGATGKRSEAVDANQTAVTLSPHDAEARSNLGNTLKELGRLDEAEASYTLAIALKPDYAEAHYNLGNTLKELGRLDEAEASYTQAIALKPDYAIAHSNLGIMLKELGRLDEAEASLRQAIASKPDYAKAHSDLGIMLKELDRLDEAEASLRQAIALKPDFFDPHFVLGITLYSIGDSDAGIESLARAYHINPKNQENELVLTVLRARKAQEQNEINVYNTSQSDHKVGLASSPIYLNRVVEPELVASLYEMQSRKMDEAKNTPVFGNGKCSLDYSMFNDDCPIIKTLEIDLIRLMELEFKSEIYLKDSFFNIYGAGAGIPPHTHLNKLDTDTCLNLAKQKYSLVYYLSVGDQDCSEPGIFKLYEPDEEILPTDGMIVIIPADRLHSAVYGGKKDRIIVGINFYSL